MAKHQIKQFYGKKYAPDDEKFWKDIEFDKKPDKEYICIGVKASNYFMPEETLSEKGPGGGKWILIDMTLAVETREGTIWSVDEKEHPRIYAVGDCNTGCIPPDGTLAMSKPPDQTADWPIPSIPKIS